VVRDPPRKSEQACRAAVRCSRRQRAQRRRPSKCGTACTERRQRNDRRERHRIRLPGTQRQRRQRVLGIAEPRLGGRYRKEQRRASSRHVRACLWLIPFFSRHCNSNHRWADDGEPRGYRGKGVRMYDGEAIARLSKSRFLFREEMYHGSRMERTEDGKVYAMVLIRTVDERAQLLDTIPLQFSLARFSNRTCFARASTNPARLVTRSA
jgi:hypothetical protein